MDHNEATAAFLAEMNRLLPPPLFENKVEVMGLTREFRGHTRWNGAMARVDVEWGIAERPGVFTEAVEHLIRKCQREQAPSFPIRPPQTPHDLIEEAAEAARRPPVQPRPGPLGSTNAAIQNYASRALGRAAAAAVAQAGEVTDEGVTLPDRPE